MLRTLSLIILSCSLLSGYAKVRTTVTSDGKIRLEYGSVTTDALGAIVTIDGKKGIINNKGEFIVSPEYDSFYTGGSEYHDPIFSDGLLSTKKGDKYGYIDTLGQVKIPFKYYFAIPFKYGLGQVKVQDAKTNVWCGYIDTEGKTIIPTKYVTIDYQPDPPHFQCEKVDENRHLIVEDLLNMDGSRVLPFEIWGFHNHPTEGFVKFSKDGMGRHYFTDCKGYIIPGTYYAADYFSHGYARVCIRDTEMGHIPVYMDSKGNYYLKGVYDWLDTFSEDGYAKVTKDGKKGLIDTDFREVIPCIYDEMRLNNHNLCFNHGMITVQRGQEWGVINRQGDVVAEFEPGVSYHINQDGTIEKTKNKMRQLLSSNGVPITEMIYEAIWNIENGYATVKRNGLCGIINLSGVEIIPPVYESIADHSKSLSQYGVVPVKKDEKWGLVDIHNQPLTEFKYRYIYDFSDGLARYNIGNRSGYLDANGKEVVPPKYYDSMGSSLYFNNGFAVVSKPVDGKWKRGYINKYGEEVIPCIFDKADHFRFLTSKRKTSDIDNFRELDFSITLSMDDIVRCSSLEKFIDMAFPLNKVIPGNLLATNIHVIDIDREIESDLEQWEVKDEFETTAQWKERTSAKARSERINGLKQKRDSELKAEKDRQDQINGEYLALRNLYEPELAEIYYEQLSNRFKSRPMNLSMYDADNECFTVIHPIYGSFLLKIPLNEARNFKYDWEKNSETAIPEFMEENGHTLLEKIYFSQGQSKYEAHLIRD